MKSREREDKDPVKIETKTAGTPAPELACARASAYTLTMIYLVEDNDGIRETVRAYLELAGFSVEEFSRVAGVIEALSFRRPDLCLLDVMLPDGNGFSLAKKIRETCPDVAFIFLTARESESDRITGLELGAEDYIVKPFSPRELVLRVQNIVRRVAPNRESGMKPAARRWLADGHVLEIDGESHSASLDGLSIHLTAVEWNILSYLSDNAGILVSRDRILGECLDYGHDGSDRAVNTHLKNIRAKLGDTVWVETVRGFGYKFIGKDTEGAKQK